MVLKQAERDRVGGLSRERGVVECSEGAVVAVLNMVYSFLCIVCAFG